MTGYLGTLSAFWVSYWTALAVGAGATVALWMPARLRGPGAVWAGTVVVACTVLLTVRWIVAGHPPVLGAFENTLMSAWSMSLVVLATSVWGSGRAREALPPLLAALVPPTLLAGRLFASEPIPMSSAERSWLGYVHAAAGWLAFALLLAATTVAIRALATRTEQSVREWDAHLLRLLGWGFIGLTATMVSGSIFSFVLFSEWYRWQIVETLAAATLLAYGLVLHARLFFAWRNRRLAVAVAAVGPLLLAAFWIWAVFPDTYHYFGLRLPH